ncbi:hypothetical protein PGT21_007223 [Puccinia graminis f. sp. tritici]|uniref:Uncharacterized protein n=1 Tax=Puccinia graminis f. sp. tritici TaxID=56615 RepID=A0A5B0NBQ3_PUCGR|nr:hypothetical protein PGT21_007223 [Puccinia graminis f. sp. tritici]KAA1130615.1 hypothetical protein PGTUg99_011844 [Puccinia graminis f. sp. tritici]
MKLTRSMQWLAVLSFQLSWLVFPFRGAPASLSSLICGCNVPRTNSIRRPVELSDIQLQAEEKESKGVNFVGVSSNVDSDRPGERDPVAQDTTIDRSETISSGALSRESSGATSTPRSPTQTKEGTKLTNIDSITARDEGKHPTSSPMTLHTSKDHVESQPDAPNPVNSYPHGAEEVEWNLKRNTQAPSKEDPSGNAVLDSPAHSSLDNLGPNDLDVSALKMKLEDPNWWSEIDRRAAEFLRGQGNYIDPHTGLEVPPRNHQHISGSAPENDA